MNDSIQTSNSPHQATWRRRKRTATNSHPEWRRHGFNAVVLTAMMALCAAAPPVLADHGKKAKTEIIPPHVQAFGTTYSELAAAWWDWAVNQPPATNPITDPTGAFCALGQDKDFGQGKDIFFLAGNYGGTTVRHCTIPKGKALFFPLVNSMWIAPEECGTPECRAIANGEMDPVTLLECIIDGKPVADVFAYRAQSPPGGSPFHIQSGGLLESFGPDYAARGYLPGSVADGYWILVDLDDAKEHVIEFRAGRGDPAPVFFLSVKYFLTVAKDKDHKR